MVQDMPVDTGFLDSRRITNRLYQYWQELRAANSAPLKEPTGLPALEQINPEEIIDLWDSCFILEVKEMDGESIGYRYQYLGKKLEGMHDGDTVHDDSNTIQTLKERKLALYEIVIDTKQPCIDESEFVNLDGDLVKYRKILLPLGDKEGRVHHILGGTRFKLYREKKRKAN